MGKSGTNGREDLMATKREPLKILVLLFFSGILSLNSYAQVQVVKFNFLNTLLHSNNDTTYVINFWATWCKPCVKELPYFEELNQKLKNEKISIVLVSLDFKRDAKSRVGPFVEKNGLKNKVVLLDEPDYDSWINKADSAWSGAIPATVICQGKVKKLYEKEFTSYLELENSIKPFLK